MQFTDEHRQLRETVQRFVRSEIDPHAEDWEASGRFPARELFPKLAALGLLGLSKPENAGGLGLDFSYEMVFAEELGAARVGGVPMAIGVQTSMATPALAQVGSKELRESFLKPAVAGSMVCSIAVSEPHAGSDVAAIKTTARKRGGDWKRVEWESALQVASEHPEELLMLDAALSRLTEQAPEHARVVELMFFAGLTGEETARALDVSPSTVDRQWRFARAWLHRELFGDLSLASTAA